MLDSARLEAEDGIRKILARGWASILTSLGVESLVRVSATCWFLLENVVRDQLEDLCLVEIERGGERVELNLVSRVELVILLHSEQISHPKWRRTTSTAIANVVFRKTEVP